MDRLNGLAGDSLAPGLRAEGPAGFRSLHEVIGQAALEIRKSAFAQEKPAVPVCHHPVAKPFHFP